MDQTPDNQKTVRLSRWRMLITPWKWSRWTWVVVAPLMLAAYLLSAVPLNRLAKQRLQSPIGTEFTEFTEYVYFPVYFCGQHSSALASVMNWEHGIMNSTLGVPVSGSYSTLIEDAYILDPSATGDDIPADAMVPMPDSGE